MPLLTVTHLCYILFSFRFPTKDSSLLSSIKFHTTKYGQCTNRFSFLCIVKLVQDTIHHFWLISDGIDFGRRVSTDSGSSFAVVHSLIDSGSRLTQSLV